MGTRPRIAVPQNSRSLGAQSIAGGNDVVDLVAYVVKSPGRIALEKALDRRCRAERLEKLDFGVRQFYEHHSDAMCRQWAGFRDPGAEHLVVKRARRPEIRHDNRDVVEPPDH